MKPVPARALRSFFLLLSLLWMPLAFGQEMQNGLDVSKYDTAAGPDGTPAFTSGTPEADGRPGQYYFNIGAYAFSHHDYALAIDMYRVAASWAYKPAEYNLAIMYALGQGTGVDLPRAMAWMTLAAERKVPKYVKAQALVAARLSPSEVVASNAILKDLQPRYADKSALLRARNQWAQVRRSATGSLTGHPMGPVKVLGADRTSTEGSIAYRSVMDRDNPYATQSVTVGELAPAAPDPAPPKAAPAATDQPLP